MLHSIFTNGSNTEYYLLSAAISIILGVLCAFTYSYKNRYTKSMLSTLLVLPLTVQTIIYLVNGNLGTGIAVAGAFSLVRFRSLPGSAKEITALFMATAIGLATGAGYLTLAVVFAILMSTILLFISTSKIGTQELRARELKIILPENLDYDGVFDDILQIYTDHYELIKIKTTNMGSLIELSYFVKLKDIHNVKAFLDQLRVKNGNLNIQLTHAISTKEETL